MHISALNALNITYIAHVEEPKGGVALLSGAGKRVISIYVLYDHKEKDSK